MSSALQQAVAVMDRLRSPGGCPWDAAQTHQSLAKYLIEETYETLEAIETGDMALLAEELPAGQRFSIDDVAGDLVDKLVHRHPHVFADVAVTGADEVNENWERLKAAEKGRTSIVEGVPMGQPALALAAKLVSRADRAGVDVPIEGDGIGERLLAVVRDAVAAGVDPELALRETARAYRDGLLE